MDIKALPTGERVLVDTNIFIYQVECQQNAVISCGGLREAKSQLISQRSFSLKCCTAR